MTSRRSAARAGIGLPRLPHLYSLHPFTSRDVGDEFGTGVSRVLGDAAFLESLMIPDFPFWPLFEFAGQAHPRPASTAIFPGVWDPACLDPESCFFCAVTQRRHPVSSEAGTLYRGTVLRDAMMLSPEAIARSPLAIRRGLLTAAIGHLRAALEQALALDAAMAAERCSEWPSLLGTIESTLHLVLPLIELQVGPMAIAGRPEAADPLLAWMRREAARRVAEEAAMARQTPEGEEHDEARATGEADETTTDS